MALVGAASAAVVTAGVGVFALTGVSRIPVAEYLLWPGSLAAWIFKGDNYTGDHEFLVHALAFGVPINALVGSMLGALLAFAKNSARRRE